MIGVEVFTRDGVDKDERTLTIESEHLEDAKKDSDDEAKIINQATKFRLIDIIKNQKVTKAKGFKKGSSIKADQLHELELNDLFSIRLADESLNEKIVDSEKQLKSHIKIIKEKFEEKKNKITRGHDLAPGVIKIVKVFLAIRRRIQPGDKMAGRRSSS